MGILDAGSDGQRKNTNRMYKAYWNALRWDVSNTLDRDRWRAKSTSGNTNMAVARLMTVGAAFALASLVLRRLLSDASIEDRSSVRRGNGFQGGVIPDHLTTCPDPTHRARLR